MKKKIAFIVAIVLMLAAFCGCNIYSTGTTTSTTANPDAMSKENSGMREWNDGNISICYPDTYWIVGRDQKGKDGMVKLQVTANIKTGDNMVITVNESNSDLVTTATEESLTEKATEGLRGSEDVKDLKVVTKKFEKTENKIDFTYDLTCKVYDKAASFQFRQVFINAGGKLYTITCNCSVTGGSKGVDSVFGKCMKTLKILDGTASGSDAK